MQLERRLLLSPDHVQTKKPRHQIYQINLSGISNKAWARRRTFGPNVLQEATKLAFDNWLLLSGFEEPIEGARSCWDISFFTSSSIWFWISFNFGLIPWKPILSSHRSNSSYSYIQPKTLDEAIQLSLPQKNYHGYRLVIFHAVRNATMASLF